MSLFLNRKITFIAAISAVLSLSAGINLPSHGDNAILQRIAAVNVPTDGRIWDFSQSELTGDEPEVRFDMIGDTCLSATLPGIRYDFELRGDTLFQVATETHFVRISDTIPLPCIVPLSATGCSGFYASRGRAYHSEYIDATGDFSLSEIARGTIIMPSGDTIADVSLTRKHTRQLMAFAMHRQPVADRDSSATLHHRDITTFSWISGLYSVPLAQYTVVTDSLGSERQGHTMASAWICPPTNQPLRNLANRAAARKFNPSGNSSAGGSSLSELSVTTTDDGVDVSGTSSGNCHVSMVLTDVLGRVFASRPRSEYNSGASVEWSCKGLPSGRYILYINCDDQPPVTHKITIK